MCGSSQQPQRLFISVSVAPHLGFGPSSMADYYSGLLTCPECGEREFQPDTDDVVDG